MPWGQSKLLTSPCSLDDKLFFKFCSSYLLFLGHAGWLR
jgi:hypothetical protein